MLEALEETLLDSLKLLPFLFITYLIMELIEHKAGKKTTEVIEKAGRFGPILGGILGVVPQCGFSVAAANLYAGRVITIGTLISIFLSTSDEMLPILISEGAPVNLIIKVLAIKIVTGIVLGCIIDIVLRKKVKKEEKIHEICEHEHCNCEEDGILKSTIKHTIQVFIYIFVISLAINIILFMIGEDKIANIMSNIPIIGAAVACFIGLIPNCASSVILTEMYLENIIELGTMIGGLLVNSGLGLLILFKVNKNKKENIGIVGILYIIGFISALTINLIF